MTTRMTLWDKDPIAKVLGPGEYIPEVQSSGGNKEVKNNAEPQRLYSCHNSKLDFIQLDDIIYDPDNLNTQQCGQKMCNHESPIPTVSRAFKSESGLEFSYDLNDLPQDKDTFPSNSDSMHYKLSILSLKISHGSQHKSFKIPTVTLVTKPKGPDIAPSAASKKPTVLFQRQKTLLILCSDVIITVWKLPVKYGDECTLLTARWIEGEHFSSDVDIRQCEYHQHLFIHDTEDGEHSLRKTLTDINTQKAA
ncbi:hypothetical protein BGX20_004532 [Mortierella sp. AD010]|nr:hypothetical protein BGX20_004532 [Mortierella sp. AD010]